MQAPILMSPLSYYTPHLALHVPVGVLHCIAHHLTGCYLWRL